jgi:hypothetical protein
MNRLFYGGQHARQSKTPRMLRGDIKVVFTKLFPTSSKLRNSPQRKQPNAAAVETRGADDA